MSSKELKKWGPHRHINGDSTDPENFKKVMDTDKAKLIFADPPYCLLTRRNKKTGALRDAKKAKINHEAVTRYPNVKAYREFTEKWMSAAIKFLDSNGTFAIWTNFLGKKPILETAENLGLFFHSEFIWGKLTKETSGNETNVRVYEVALLFKNKPYESEIILPDSAYIPKSVITHYDEEGETGNFNNHPNHKPFSSLEPIIRTYSDVGDRILDPFTGSGSTPAASIKLERVVSGIELREEWAKISQDRLFKLSSQTMVKSE
ncbi:MAG: site-specific DNA-methyltransferase [Bacteriovoracaceae bacterium]|jgi:site-specific DNA-methyltransferase (adenine-specific)|nr:site-specific DNA-methyltransferase [Bacteriovoracaceae bacterium]